MTFLELQKILDDKDKKLTSAEFKQVISELKKDCSTKLDEYDTVEQLRSRQAMFVRGREDAFRLVLRLLDHLESSIIEPKISEEMFSSLLDKLIDSVLDDFAEVLLTDISNFILGRKKVDIDDFALYVCANYGGEYIRLICKLKDEFARKNK